MFTKKAIVSKVCAVCVKRNKCIVRLVLMYNANSPETLDINFDASSLIDTCKDYKPEGGIKI